MNSKPIMRSQKSLLDHIVDSLDATPKEKDGGIQLSPKLKQFNGGQSSGEVNFFGHRKKSSLIKVNHESIPEDEHQDDVVEVNGNPYDEYKLQKQSSQEHIVQIP